MYGQPSERDIEALESAWIHRIRTGMDLLDVEAQNPTLQDVSDSERETIEEAARIYGAGVFGIVTREFGRKVYEIAGLPVPESQIN